MPQTEELHVSAGFKVSDNVTTLNVIVDMPDASIFEAITPLRRIPNQVMSSLTIVNDRFMSVELPSHLDGDEVKEFVDDVAESLARSLGYLTPELIDDPPHPSLGISLDKFRMHLERQQEESVSKGTRTIRRGNLWLVPQSSQ